MIHTKKNEELHLICVGLKGRFDSLNRKIILDTLNEYEIPKKLIKVAKPVYKEVNVEVRVKDV